MEGRRKIKTSVQEIPTSVPLRIRHFSSFSPSLRRSFFKGSLWLLRNTLSFYYFMECPLVPADFSLVFSFVNIVLIVISPSYQIDWYHFAIVTIIIILVPPSNEIPQWHQHFKRFFVNYSPLGFQLLCFFIFLLPSVSVSSDMAGNSTALFYIIYICLLLFLAYSLDSSISLPF